MSVFRACLLACLVIASSTLAPAAMAADPGAAPKIAVLRLDEIINRSKPWISGMQSARQAQADLEKAVGELDELVRQREGQLQVLKRDSDNYAKFAEEVETTKLRRKLLVERTRNDLERRQVALVKDAFKGVRGSLAAFCRERGVMLVHSAPTLDLVAPSLQDIQLELGLKPVLYYDPSLDITEAFMTFMTERQSSAAPGELPASDAPSAAPNPGDGK